MSKSKDNNNMAESWTFSAPSETSKQTLDDLIVCLLGMGFELGDCQQAVQMGFTTADAAVEWLLQGKPGLRTKQQSLKLRSPLGSQAQPIVESDDEKARGSLTPEDSNRGQIPSEPLELVSHIQPSDEQQRIRDEYEKKLRKEAEKKAKAERIAEKVARTAVLQQIQEDREKQRFTKQSFSTESSSSETTIKESKTAIVADEPVKQQSSNVANIQVRLPSGKVVRLKLPADASLKQVREMVEKEDLGATFSLSDLVFIQPFPKRKFSGADEHCSLEELHLTPSGSLVMKRSEDANEKLTKAGVEVDSSISSSSHSLASSVSSPSGQISMHELPLSREQSDHENPGRIAPGIHFGQRRPPQRDQHMPPEFFNQMADDMLRGTLHHWGEGQRLVDDSSIHAEQQRRLWENAPLPENYQPHSSGVVEEDVCMTTHTVPSLSELCVRIVSQRICSPTNSITSLALPAHIATKILEHLIKAKLLKAKTLLPFVSCHLQKIVLDNYLYTTNELVQTLRFHCDLVHISLASSPLITEASLSHLSSLRNLAHLNLARCTQIFDSSFTLLIEFPSLVSLNVEGTQVSNNGIVKYCKARPPLLQILILNRTGIDQTVIPFLAEIENLRQLSLEDTQIAGLSGVQQIKKLDNINVASTNIITDTLLCLAQCPNLTVVNVANTDNVNGDHALQYLSNLNLKSLILPSRHTTTDIGLYYIRQMSLTSLDLTNYIKITDEGIFHLSGMISLKKLLLSNTKITNVGLSALRGLVNLETLYLDRTAVTNTCGATLANFSRLTELSLSCTKINRKFLMERHVNNCQSLTKLNLSRTKVDDRGLVHLCLPRLTLLQLDCTRVRDPWSVIAAGCPELETISAKNLVHIPRGESSEDEN